MQRLTSTLNRIDGKGYGAYKSIAGSYDMDGFTLFIDKVQRDPFAPPSLIRVRTDANRFDPALFRNPVRRTAFADFLTRRATHAINRIARGNRGTGGSGKVEMQQPSQVVLPRTAMVVADDYIEARMAVGLPAQRRSVDARAARAMLLDELPAIVREALTPEHTDIGRAMRHVETVEDADALRNQLAGHNLTAFVADGAVLPRESGASDHPLRDGAVPFRSPGEYQVSIELPNRGTITGMGVPEGVTLIAGGGFHGKSTLLEALSWGVYDHIPGDGREFVVTRLDAVKIRAEDGRSITGVDISDSIGQLPGGRDTMNFSTANASGSTSQAANISEALEIGTSLLLVDEDTSATNFMIRDARMRALVQQEPITPFIDLVRPLHRELGLSTVVVIGGVGDYLDVADHVILMEEYVPRDATAEAGAVRERLPLREPLDAADVHRPGSRTIRPASIDLRRGKRDTARARGRQSIELGREQVDLAYLEQLAERGQTEAIARIIAEIAGGKDSPELRARVETALNVIRRDGLDALGNFRGHPGELGLPRAQEVAAAINRIRSLQAGTVPS